LTGPIPATLGNLLNLSYLSLEQNFLSGPIPTSLGNLKEIFLLELSNNRLNNTIPSSLGNLVKLRICSLYENQLSGFIPTSLGNLPNLRMLWLYNNQLTGYPSSLNGAFSKKIFPNPMSSIPYDLVVPVSIGTLTNVTLVPFLNTPALLRKRQTLSSQATLTTEALLKTCPLNSGIGSAAGADVAAGCVAGIFQKWCDQPASNDLTILRQCHEAYNKVFAASFFKPLGDACPAWKKGPQSQSCVKAINNFSYSLYQGIGPSGSPVYLNLNSTHAADMVKTTFGNPAYAPCPTTLSVCNWRTTAA
jgi:hypothetical protein